MAIDIRATVTCSLGHPILSGSISDDYLQGSGLIKTKGTLELSALITPAVGTAVTFSYVKNGVTRTLPRKLRVLSSFADPFRRTTKIELGCKLTYLNDLKDPIKWDAFDDPENSTYTAEDDRIVTLPIRASSVMAQCLSQLGISASASPLTNSFSIAEFDFSAGYVSVLNDLLISESYFGYLDANEVLQVRTLVATGGSGPAFTAADIVDLGSIGVGQLPGEAVTVSYSTLKLKSPTEEQEQDEETKAKANWEEDESIGVPTTVRVENPFWASNPFPFPVPQFFEYTYTPRSVSTTTYDALDRVVQRVTTEYTIMADIAPSYIQYIAGTDPANGPGIGSAEYTTISTEKFTYVVSANTPNLDPKNPPNGYEEIEEQVNTVEEPFLKLYASTPIYSILGQAGDTSLVGINLNNALKFVAEKTVTTTDYGVGRSNAQIAKTISAKYICQAYTQEGQQSISSYIESNNGTENFTDRVSALLLQSSALTALGNEIQLTTGREIGLQQRPSSAALTNDELNAAKDDPDADPNNGWRVASESELELALGSATAQRRIELSMPYAPDDTFSGPTGGPFTAIPSDAPQKATNFGRTQNQLLLGNRSGINLQLSPERLPTAPFDPLYVQASGLTALYRANGTSWAFDSNGIVASVDALFWGAVGGTGTFWFPVAPGITTLPAEPAIVDGAINATTVVLPYNETVIYDSRIRLLTSVSKFDYSLELLTIAPATVIHASTFAARIFKVEVPAAAVTVAAAAPLASISASVYVPITTTTLDTYAPSVLVNVLVSVPTASVILDALPLQSVGIVSTSVFVPSSNINLELNIPSVSTGINLTIPVYDTAIAAVVPTITITTAPQFETLLYTGTGSSLAVTGAGFEPGFVLTKRRLSLTQNHTLYDYARGTTKYWTPSGSAAEATDAQSLTSFDADGFTLGTSTISNSAYSYVAWCIRKGGTGSSNTDGTITSTVYANADVGMNIFTYTGTGANATVGHGLGASPELVIFKNLFTTVTTAVGGSFLASNEYLVLSTNAAKATASTLIQSVSSTTVSIGTSTAVNENTRSIVGYAFKSVTGVSKVGTYTGSGASDQAISVGFQPSFVLIKAYSTTGNWMLFDSVRGVTKQLLTTNAIETTVDKVAFNANDFTVKASQDTNTSSVSYVYLAFA